MISASSGLCSLADCILLIILFVGAKGFSTSVILTFQILNLFVWISAEIDLFSKYQAIIYKVLELCLTNIHHRLDTFEHKIRCDYWIIVILYSFVDVMDLQVILLIMFWCQTRNSYRKYQYPYRVLLKEHFSLMVFLLTPQTLWWFWQWQGHMFPNKSMINHHVCWPNLLPHQLIWLPCCFARALGQKSFSKILYLTFERKKILS